MKILAAILTFNRSVLLSRCIDSVLCQTRPPDELIVINNGSTDNTLIVLSSRNINVITQENVGSSGGWHTAIEYAINFNFDAIWLMDDDGYADPFALSLLEEKLLPNVSCASSIVVNENSHNFFVFPFPLLKNNLFLNFFPFGKIKKVNELSLLTKDGVYPFVHLFNGALLSIEAIRKVGNVRREFFIYGEEVDYFFRLRKYGCVISVLGALQFHPDVNKRPFNSTKVYYYIKNTLILNRIYYNFIWFRNILMIILILIRLSKRNSLYYTLLLIFGSYNFLLYRAIYRGLNGNLGRDF